MALEYRVTPDAKTGFPTGSSQHHVSHVTLSMLPSVPPRKENRHSPLSRLEGFRGAPA
jgi:hypothetical protein